MPVHVYKLSPLIVGATMGCNSVTVQGKVCVVRFEMVIPEGIQGRTPILEFPSGISVPGKHFFVVGSGSKTMNSTVTQVHNCMVRENRIYAGEGSETKLYNVMASFSFMLKHY